MSSRTRSICELLAEAHGGEVGERVEGLAQLLAAAQDALRRLRLGRARRAAMGQHLRRHQDRSHRRAQLVVEHAEKERLRLRLGRREGRRQLGQAAVHGFVEPDQVVEVRCARRGMLAAPLTDHRRAQRRVVADQLAGVRMRHARRALASAAAGDDALAGRRFISSATARSTLPKMLPARDRLGARRRTAVALPFGEDVLEALVDEVRQAHDGRTGSGAR